jgi:hypothetical protein
MREEVHSDQNKNFGKRRKSVSGKLPGACRSSVLDITHII